MKKTTVNGEFKEVSSNTYTSFDLSRYGIFKEADKNNYIDNCLYLALKAGGLETDKLQQLKTYFLKSKHTFIEDRWTL